MTGLLDGLTNATVLAAMSPQLPSALVRHLLDEARAGDVGVHLLVADLSGTWDFLSTAAQNDLIGGRLRVTVLAGTVPRRFAHFVGHLPVPLWEVDRLIARGTLGIDVFVARVSAAGHEQLRIAQLAASLVPDGATLQLGVGALPDLVAAQLIVRTDLGLHSGLLAGGVQALVAAGAATGRRKTRDSGRHVATGIFGGDPDGWGDDVLLQPLSTTHDPRLLLEQGALWAVNSAYRVDLAGQVNAEYIAGLRRSSGAGQADFARAAHAGSGASVIVVPSRTRDGRPRIVPALDCPVTTPSSDIDYVVTEHGVAGLTGRTAAERAAALIGVAHPGDRDELVATRSERRNVV